MNREQALQLSVPKSPHFLSLKDGRVAFVSLSLAGDTHDFSSTQINLPSEHAAKVLAMAHNINDEDLADDGRETIPHVTVKYGLHTADSDDISAAMDGESPVVFEIGDASVFPANEKRQSDVIKLDVKSPDLERLNSKLSALPNTNTHAGYHPHVTVAYVKPGLGAKYASRMNDLRGTKIKADRLRFSSKSGMCTDVPLGKPPMTRETALSLSDNVDGHWVTIEGEHVYIKDGKIEKGPADLVGKKPGELSEGSKLSHFAGNERNSNEGAKIASSTAGDANKSGPMNNMVPWPNSLGSTGGSGKWQNELPQGYKTFERSGNGAYSVGDVFENKGKAWVVTAQHSGRHTQFTDDTREGEKYSMAQARPATEKEGEKVLADAKAKRDKKQSIEDLKKDAYASGTGHGRESGPDIKSSRTYRIPGRPGSLASTGSFYFDDAAKIAKEVTPVYDDDSRVTSWSGEGFDKIDSYVKAMGYEESGARKLREQKEGEARLVAQKEFYEKQKIKNSEIKENPPKPRAAESDPDKTMYVRGETFSNKDKLKQMGLRWHPDKKAWYGPKHKMTNLPRGTYAAAFSDDFQVVLLDGRTVLIG